MPKLCFEAYTSDLTSRDKRLPIFLLLDTSLLVDCSHKGCVLYLLRRCILKGDGVATGRWRTAHTQGGEGQGDVLFIDDIE